MTGIIDNSQTEERKRWGELLHAAWMYHQQLVKETAPELINEKADDTHVFHQAVSVAIRDAINLIQQMEAMGYFDTEEDVLLSKPGPMG